MITKSRAKFLDHANNQNLAPESMNSFKMTRRFNPIWLLSFTMLIVLISGCSIVDIGNITAAATLESTLNPEPTITRTLVEPKFSETSTPSPNVILDSDATLRPSWTPGKPTSRPSWTPTQPLPTKTLRPTWTATITPTPTLTPELGLLLSEDFSDQNNPHWIQKSGTNWATWIFNGVYAMQVTAPYVEISAGPAWLKIDEVALEVDVTRKQGHGYFGFACRELGSTYYSIFISTKGYYGFGETRGGEITFINYTSTKLIDTAIGAVNHIRGECRGDTLTLYINGTWAGQQKVEGVGPGFVSILTGTTWEQSQVVAHFDNLRIWTPADPIYYPPPTSTSTATSTETPSATLTATP